MGAIGSNTLSLKMRYECSVQMGNPRIKNCCDLLTCPVPGWTWYSLLILPRQSLTLWSIGRFAYCTCDLLSSLTPSLRLGLIAVGARSRGTLVHHATQATAL